MTHVLLVPDKCTPDFWPKTPLKKFFSRDFYPILPYIKNYVEKLLKISNNWYIIKYIVNIWPSYLYYIYKYRLKGEIKMGKIIGYCRVSSKKQLNEGNSLEIQESTIKEKYKDAIIYKEQYTGKTTNRPVFDEICKSLEKGDTLVVTKLDRLCRNVNEGSSLIANLREKGVSIHIMNMALIEEGPVGDLMMNMLLGFAQFERDMIIARTTEGRERAKANGTKFGRKEKFTEAQLNDALSKLNINGGTLTYKDIEREYKISKSTLIRYKNKVEADRVRGER